MTDVGASHLTLLPSVDPCRSLPGSAHPPAPRHPERAAAWACATVSVALLGTTALLVHHWSTPPSASLASSIELAPSEVVESSLRPAAVPHAYATPPGPDADAPHEPDHLAETHELQGHEHEGLLGFPAPPRAWLFHALQVCPPVLVRFHGNVSEVVSKSGKFSKKFSKKAPVHARMH